MLISNCTIGSCGCQPIQHGVQWVNCTISDTPLVIETATPQMSGCRIINCPISFVGPAVGHEAEILAMLKARNSFS